jgi:hypothetical protein
MTAFPTPLRRQLTQLEGQEDRLIEMVSDGDLPVAKLKARLRAVSLQREHLKERLTRIDDELVRGSAQIETYLDLLSNAGRLYQHADDLVRRQLFEAFFPPAHIDVDDDVTVNIEAHPAVRALSASEGTPGLPESESDPRLAARVRFVNAVELFFALVRPKGSNKSFLVAGTGFEPATSGL